MNPPAYLFTRADGERLLCPFDRSFLNDGETREEITDPARLAQVEAEHANPYLYRPAWKPRYEGDDSPIPVKRQTPPAPGMLLPWVWVELHGEKLKQGDHRIRLTKTGHVADCDHPSAAGRRRNLNAAIQARNNAGVTAWIRGAIAAGRVLTEDEIRAFAHHIASVEGREAAERELARFGWIKSDAGPWGPPRLGSPPH